MGGSIQVLGIVLGLWASMGGRMVVGTWVADIDQKEGLVVLVGWEVHIVVGCYCPFWVGLLWGMLGLGRVF